MKSVSTSTLSSALNNVVVAALGLILMFTTSARLTGMSLQLQGHPVLGPGLRTRSSHLYSANNQRGVKELGPGLASQCVSCCLPAQICP